MCIIRRLRTFLLTTLAVLPLVTQAELVWDKEKGWSFKGGVLSHFFGSEVEARNGIELMNFARQAEERGEYFQALTLYQRVVEEYGTSVLAPEALYRSGIVYRKRSQFNAAFESFEKILKRYPNYPKYNQVVREQYEVAVDIMEGKRPKYWGFIPGFKTYSEAYKDFEKVIENARYTNYAPMSLMNIASMAQKHHKPEEAIDALDRLINDYPKNSLVPDAYLMMAKVHEGLVIGPAYDQGATRESISYYEDFTILFPQNPKIDVAEEGLARTSNELAKSKLLIGDFYYSRRNNLHAAKIYYNAAITVAPNSDAAKQARAQLAKVEAGILAPKTPVDYILGRYQKESIKDIEQEAQVSRAATVDSLQSEDEFIERPVPKALEPTTEEEAEAIEEASPPKNLDDSPDVGATADNDEAKAKPLAASEKRSDSLALVKDQAIAVNFSRILQYA